MLLLPLFLVQVMYPLRHFLLCFYWLKLCSYLLMMNGRNDYLMKISISSGILAISLALACMKLGLGSLSIAWSFCIAAIFRNLVTYIVALKLCGVNTAIYLDPVSVFKSLKMIKSKQFSGL